MGFFNYESKFKIIKKTFFFGGAEGGRGAWDEGGGQSK